MNKFTSFCQKIFTKFCEQGVTDRASFIKNITVVGFILSSVAQTTALIFNEKIPTKEKKFLVPQEIADGIINATLFWVIASKAVNFGKSLILTKKVLPKSLVPFMKNYQPQGKDIAILKENFLKHLSSQTNSENIKLADNTIEGMGVVTGIAGAILTNNILTPILRNKLASNFQQKEIEKMENNPPLNPYYSTFNFSNYNFNKPISPVTSYHPVVKI